MILINILPNIGRYIMHTLLVNCKLTLNCILHRPIFQNHLFRIR